MSFLGGLVRTVGRGITGPFRAIGDVAQGKFRNALGDLGDTGKLVAPVLTATGVGAPLGMAIGGASGAASTWGHGENNIGKVLGGAAGGAALAGAGSLARPLFAGGGEGALTGFTGGTGAGLDATGTAAADAAAAGSNAAQAVLPKVGQGIGARLAAGAGNLITKHPEVATSLASTGANIYGENQAGAAKDHELDLAEKQQKDLEDQRERQFQLDKQNALVNLMASFRPRY